MLYEEKITTRSQAQKMLERMKEIENDTKLYRFNLDDKTTLYCKNKERIKDYKKKNSNG